MSIVSRIYRILRANIPDQKKPALDDGLKSNSETEAWDTPLDNGETMGARDPELARYYANLEVPYGADLKTVRESWKRLLRKYHPDLHSSDVHKRQVANELTQGLNRAYEALSKHLENDPAK